MDDDLLNPGTSSSTSSKPGVILQAWKRSTQIYQSMLDRWTPYSRWRWASTMLLLLLFGLRIFTKQWWSGVVDMTVPWRTTRWVSVVLLILLFLARVLYAQGWYIVTYALGIYHLNIFIAFLTPKLDPAMDFDDDNGPELPTRANEEFRPFIRRLPEFKFWYSMTKSTVIGFVCTFFDCFNIPVFWPILVMYFITLFYITMKRQIQHMIKYRYLPFTHSKPKYQNEESIKLPNASN